MRGAFQRATAIITVEIIQSRQRLARRRVNAAKR
jgi:hypothetical protein